MAISLVQKQQTNSGTASSLTVTFTSALTAGNAVILGFETGGTVSTVKLSDGTNLTSRKTELSTVGAYVYDLFGVAGGETSVTVTLTGSSTIVMDALEVSGLSGTVDASVGNTGVSSTYSSGTVSTTNAVDLWVGVAAVNGSGFTPGTPAGWTLDEHYGTPRGFILCYQLTSATGSMVFSSSIGTSTQWGACAVAYEASTNINLSLPVATVTIASPAPSIPATVALPVATVTIGTPAPTVGAVLAVALPVATVTVASPAPGVGNTTALPVATVAVATPAPSLSVKVPLAVAPVMILAPSPGISTTVALPVATLTIATPAPGVTVNRFVALPTATLTIAAFPPSIHTTRNLLVSIASQAGTDDYGTAFPAGFKTTDGVIQGSTISGSLFQGTDFTLNSAGAFYYSGTPAAGNLALSIAQASGTDGFGNAYLPGFVTYGMQSGFQVATQVTTGAFQFYSASSQAGPYLNNSSIFVDSSGNVNIDSTSIQLPSSSINGHAVNFAFLGQIGQMSHYGGTATGGWTSGGSIVGSTQINTTVLTNWMNEVVADIQTILTRLQAENYMA